jgi:uncharacterized integral membrane protein
MSSKLSRKVSHDVASATALVVAMFASVEPVAAAGSTIESPYATWAIGLICGIILALAARINWRSVPGRLLNWARRQRHRAGWAMLGSFCTAILIFY